MINSQNMSKQKGFTLLELLVVIAIIGLLTTIAIVSFNNTQAKARDAKRISDIRNIRTAVEAYFATNGSYPAPSDWNNFRSLLNSYFVSGSVPSSVNSGSVNGNQRYEYCFKPSTNANKYLLAVQLERPGIIAGDIDGMIGAWTGGNCINDYAGNFWYGNCDDGAGFIGRFCLGTSSNGL